MRNKLAKAKVVNKLPKILIPVHFAGVSCDMEQIYFSRQNFNTIYGIISKSMNEKHSISIDDDSKYYEKILEILKFNYKHMNEYNIDPNLEVVDKSRYLSQKVVNMALNYFDDQYKKSKIDRPEHIVKPMKEIK